MAPLRSGLRGTGCLESACHHPATDATQIKPRWVCFRTSTLQTGCLHTATMGNFDRMNKMEPKAMERQSTMGSKPLKMVGGFGAGSGHRPLVRDAALMGGARPAKLPLSLKGAPQVSGCANPPALSGSSGVALGEKVLWIMNQVKSWKSDWKGAG